MNRRRSRWRKLRKKWREGYVRVLRSPGAPNEVARGMALGLFVAMLPIMGLQMPVAVATAEFFRRLTGIRMSRVASAAGVWLTNPLTAAPIYGVCYLVGKPFTRWLMPGTTEEMPATVDASLAASDAGAAATGATSQPLALDVVVALVIGGVILGVPIAIVGYRITYSMVERYQQRSRARKQLRLSQTQGQAASPG